MIRKGTSLDEFIETQRKQDANKTSFAYRISDIDSWDPENLTFSIGGEERELTTYALKQLLKKLKIPYPYFQQCSPELRDKELREAFGDANKKTEFTFRVLNTGEERTKIYGIIPPQYYSALTSNFIERVKKELPGDLVLDIVDATLEHAHIRFLAKDQSFIEKDELVPAVDLWFSEVGEKPFLLQSTIFRKVCSNGMMLPETSAPVIKIPMTRFKEEQFQAAMSSIKEDILDNILPYAETLERLKDIPLPEKLVEGDPQGVLLEETKNLVIPSRALQADFGDIIMKFFSQDKNYTVNGFVNAVTRTARDIEDSDRFALEATAGAFVSRITSLQRDYTEHGDNLEYSIPNFKRLFKRHN